MDRMLLVALLVICSLLSVPFLISFLNGYPYRLNVPLRPLEETWLQIHQVLPFDHLEASADDGSGLWVRMSSDPIERQLVPAEIKAADSINLCQASVDMTLLANATAQLIWQSNSSVPLDIYLDNERVNGSVAPEYGQMTLSTPLVTTYSAVNALSLTEQVFIFASTRSDAYRLRVKAVERPPECEQGLAVVLWLEITSNGVTGKFSETSPVTPLTFPLVDYHLPEGQKSAYLIVRNLRDSPNSFTLTAHLTTAGFLWNLLMSLLSGPLFGLYILVVFLCFPCGWLLQWIKSRWTGGKQYPYAVLEEGKQ